MTPFRFFNAALLLGLAACNGSTAPETGRPDELQLRIELGRGTISRNDSIPVRLVARNPLSVAIESRMNCGDRGLTIEAYDRWGDYHGPGTPICIDEAANGTTLRIAAGDSIVATVMWSPRIYIGGRLISDSEPGGYAILGVFESERRVWTRSTPVGIVVRDDNAP